MTLISQRTAVQRYVATLDTPTTTKAILICNLNAAQTLLRVLPVEDPAYPTALALHRDAQLELWRWLSRNS